MNLELIPDGSADPPGDRLEFLPLLGPDVREARCEIRAYVVSADRKQAQAVRCNGSSDCDADGVFLISRRVKQDNEPTKLSIVIPYAELKLDKGSHWLGYCVTIKCTGKPPVEVATRLTQVVISDQPRNQMKLQQRTTQPSMETREQNGIVGSEVGAKGAALRQKFSTSVPTIRSKTKTSDIV
ncbi:MAG TPA: hypothetical protein VGJ04_08110, partial [Pirellulales bacterium]